MNELWKELLSRIHELLSMAWLKGALAALVGVLLGGWSGVHTAFSILLLVDLVLGVWRAWREGTLDPRVARNKTLAKLGLYWLLLIAAHQVDEVIPGDSFASTATLSYLSLTEFLSILRNASAIYGRPLTPFGWRKLLDELGVTDEKGQKRD